MSEEEFIPYGRQTIGEDDVAAVAHAVTSDFLTTGPLVEQLEAVIAREAGVSHCAVVNSGTAALHAAYHALGVGPGDEVIVPPLTFAATANAALYLGARVVFADVDPRTGNLDPDAAAAACTPRTKVIVAVDFTGHPADYARLRALAPNTPLVADAAHSLGASRNGERAGALADLSTFSTHPVKAVTTGEGGAVTTNDARLDMRARAFRTHGLVRDVARFTSSRTDPWIMEQQTLGYNYRLPDLNCALGLSQMGKLTSFIASRRTIAARYSEAFSDLAEVEIPFVEDGVEPAWHLYTLKVRDASRRRAFFDALRARSLGVQVHYAPVYYHPYYRDLGFEEGLCPVAEDIYSRIISLPVFPAMNEGMVEQVISRVRSVAREIL